MQARWTEEILNEWFRSILRRRPELEAPLRRTRELMIAAVPDCLVRGYEELIETLSLPDPEDRHVLAAAIHGGARMIVTANLSDFPTTTLAPLGIAARHPDDFVSGLIDREPDAVANVVKQQAADLRSPPRTALDLLDIFNAQGLRSTTHRLRTILEIERP